MSIQSAPRGGERRHLGKKRVRIRNRSKKRDKSEKNWGKASYKVCRFSGRRVRGGGGSSEKSSNVQQRQTQVIMGCVGSFVESSHGGKNENWRKLGATTLSREKGDISGHLAF